MKKIALLFCAFMMLTSSSILAFSAGYERSDVQTVIDTAADDDRVILEGKLSLKEPPEVEEMYVFSDETGVIDVQIDAVRFRLYEAALGKPMRIFGMYKAVDGKDKIIVERLEML